MKKYLLRVNTLVLFVVAMFVCINNADARKKKSKKRKKATTTTTTAPIKNTDSTVTIYREPGVKNQRQLDSIKAEKLKQKQAYIQQNTISSNVLVISFTSRASGIDRTAAETLENEIKGFNAKNKNCTLQMDMVSWGREGERDYCITANSQTCLDEFAKAMITKFKGNERIFITENGKCRPKRN